MTESWALRRQNEYKELREDVEANKDKLPDVRVVDGLIFKRTPTRNGGSDAEENSWMLWVPESRKLCFT